MFKELIARLVLITFFFTSVGPLPDVSAQNLIDLPAPGMMVNRSNSFEPLQLKGILVNVKNPMRFDFLVDKGDSDLYGQPLKDNITRLAKYFLTCLTVPEDDLWVNLSPYEKDRIVPGNFGVTLMGEDLLEQDYLLKQIMASLSYPENDLGKRFWQRVYRRSYELYGTTDIPINTFNKVWITPKTAQVYVQGNAAFVVNSQLDVMLEADYKAFVHHFNNQGPEITSSGFSKNAGAYSQVFRDVILPELRSEVNEGKNFAVVRQVFNAMILATWYKRHLKDSLLGKIYVGQNKVKGVDVADKNVKERIFQQYLRAYKKCVYNYIKEDYDPSTNQTVPHKYASGGMYFVDFAQTSYNENGDPRAGKWIGTDLALATVDVSATNSAGGIVSFPDMRAQITDTNPFHQVPLEDREGPLPVKNTNVVLNDQAMLVPNFFRPVFLALALAVGGFMMTPTMASAASPASPNTHISANMDIQDVTNILDKQIKDYKQKIDKQDSLLNILGILGDSDDSRRILSGLVKEEAFTRSLLAAGKVDLDKPTIASIEVARLSGQIEGINKIIDQHEQRLRNEKADFAKRDRSYFMHAGEISMRQGNIRYHEGVLKGLNAQKDKLSGERKIDEDILLVNTPPPQELVKQVVSSAIGSGVNPVVPLPTQPVVVPSTQISTPATAPVVATSHVETVSPTTMSPTTKPILTHAPSVPSSNFVYTNPFSNFNLFTVTPSYQIVLTLDMQLSLSVVNNPVEHHVSAGSAPPPPPENTNSTILQDASASWAWYAGIAMMGIGISVAGASILKKNRPKKLNTQPSVVPKRSPGTVQGNNGQSEKWAFNVVTNQGPAIPDDAELAWQQQQQQQAIASIAVSGPQMPLTANDQPVNSGLRVMDVLGLTMSTGLAAIYSGGDLKTILAAFLSSLLVTRLIYAGYTFLHENGHSTIALIQSPKNYKKIRTWPNFFVNYDLPNWLRLALAFGKPTHRPGVDLPLTGSARRFNQVAGFAVTLAISGLAFWTAAATGLWLPLFGSLGAASVFAILNSFDTDILNSSSDGRINCGDSGFIWLPKKLKSDHHSNGKPRLEDFFPKFVQTGLLNFRSISGLRGDQGEGLETYVRTRDGDVVPIGSKNLKDKRGKPVAEVAQDGLKEEIEDAINQGAEPLDDVREVITHDRFLTQGIPSLKGLHPHLGVVEKRVLCFFENGVYQKRERTVVTTVIENGDNNYHQKHGRKMPTREIRQFYPIKFHMEKNVFIEPNPKFPKGYYDYLPSGDAPALALQEQWYDNQGDWWAASRFAADEVFYKNDKEAMEYNLSKDEVNVMGDFYMRVYEDGHEQILVRPKLEKRNKTLADSWATAEMAKQDKRFAFQYNALQHLRADLKRDLLIEVDKAGKDENTSEVGNILNRLQALHPEDSFEEKIDRFVNMTVERFFTADIMEAAKEIDQLEEEGAYGVRILSTKYPGRGVFWTKGQSVALGVNLEAGYMAYNSEHTALKSGLGDAPPIKEILFLNSEGRGQLTETNYNEETGGLDLRAWSPELGRFLKENELKEWRMPLNDKNRYWTPLVDRDPSTVTDEDIDEITKVTRDVKKIWANPGSFVRQSADNLVDKLKSRFVEDYIKNNSRFYKVMQGDLLYKVEQEAQNCRGEQCNSVEYQDRVAALLREVQNDPRVLSYLKSCLDQLVAYEADIFTQQIRRGKKTENDLFPQLKIIDQQLSELMSSKIKVLTQNLINHNLQFLNDFQAAQGQLVLNQTAIEELWDSGDQNAGELKPNLEGQGLPREESIGAGDAVFFVGGFEDSLWIGAENFKAMMNVFFPKMIIETDSTNKALNLKPGDRHKVGRRSLGLIVSKSGATSPSKNLVNVLKSINGIDNIFGETGTVDTLLGLALGQRYNDDSPFFKRIFPTGNVYPTEVNSISEVELLLNQIEMVLYIVKAMKETFPHQRPWGMNISDENIKKIEEWRDDLVNKARHLTGVDEDGNPGTYPEHQKIIHDARIFGKMLTEMPLSNLLNRAYVYSIIYLGTPIGLLAAYIEHKTGLTVHSSGLGHVAWAFLDTTITCCMPWWITTGFYRLFSGRAQRKARLGPPKVFIGDIPVLHQVIENSASKRGSNAIGSMDMDIHGGNPQDHFGARFGHRTGGRPGKLLIFGLPEDPHAYSDVTLTLSQCNVRTDMAVGWKIWDRFWGKKNSGAPETFTIGPGDNIDPNLSQHHMSTGPFQTVFINSNGERELKPGVTETLAQFHALSFEVFDRLVAYNVFFNEGYRYATHWGPWQIWRQGETYSRTGVFSTPSPRGGPKKALPYYNDADFSYSAAAIKNGSIGPKKDLALLTEQRSQQIVSRDGGINMNSRLMKLNISGDTQNRVGVDDMAMSENAVKGIVPKVSGIVTVTPDMLKAMLGPGYLN